LRLSEVEDFRFLIVQTCRASRNRRSVEVSFLPARVQMNPANAEAGEELIRVLRIPKNGVE
jgi:hypothetical protein